jgi:cytochrome c oxidase subunit IV
MPKIQPKEKKLVGIVSAVLGVFMAVLSLVAYFVLRFQGLPFDWDQLLILSFMIALFPPAVVEFLDLHWEHL